MRPSLILRTSAPMLLWLSLLASLYVLLRGHNEPGGGFLGGLVAASGLLFHAIARGPEGVRTLLVLHPVQLSALGVLLAATSGLPAFLGPDGAYLTHLWWFAELGVTLPLGTALLFDLGVYLAVVGMAVAIFIGLLEWKAARAAATEGGE